MTRLALNLVTAVSALLCVASLALWVRSSWVQDIAAWESPRGAYVIYSSIGQLTFRRVLYGDSPPPDMRPGWQRLAERPGDVSVLRPDFADLGWASRLGFMAYAGPDTAGTHSRLLTVPHWFVALLCAAFPAGTLVLFFRRRGGVVRPALHGLAVLSAMLALTLAGLWLRSYRESEWVVRQTPGGLWGFSSSQGRFSVNRQTISSGRHVQFPFRRVDGPKTDLRQWPEHAPPTIVRFERGGVSYRTRTDTGTAAAYEYLIAPYWMAVLLAAALPAWSITGGARGWLARRRHRRRGLCPRCGYDLRATPGRCPECGHATGSETTGLAQ